MNIDFCYSLPIDCNKTYYLEILIEINKMCYILTHIIL